MDTDERLAFVSIDEPDAEPWLAPVPEDGRRATWRLVQPDGRYLEGGEAAVALLEAMKPLRPIGRLARRLRLERTLGALDAVVKRNRGRLGKVVPNVPPTRRFP